MTDKKTKRIALCLNGQPGTLMNAENIFTDYFKETGLYDRFKKYNTATLKRSIRIQ